MRMLGYRVFLGTLTQLEHSKPSNRHQVLWRKQDIRLTLDLAMELAEHNIRVNAVSPAIVDTPLYESLKEPSSRIGITKDISNTMSFLLSEKSNGVTDAALDIDCDVMTGRN